MKINGEDIPGSPFDLICYANPNVDVSKTVITANDNVYKVGENLVFAIIDEVKDAYDNTIMVTRINGYFTFDVSFSENTILTNEHSMAFTDPIVNIHTVLNYYFEVEFECTVPGTVTLSIYYNSG